MEANLTPLFTGRPRAVIFDCDGVALDSRASHQVFFNDVRRAVGLGPMSAEEEAFGFIHTVDESLIFMIPPDQLALARRAAAGYDWSGLVPHLKLQPGLVQMLDRLAALGLRRAMNTNSGAEVGLFLDRLGLAGRFEMVVTAADVTHPKPDPEGARLILDRFQLPAETAWYIGDSEVDRRTAAAAGLTFLSFRQPDLRAARLLTGWADLEAILAALPGPQPSPPRGAA